MRVPTTDALPRERLETLLDSLWRHRLGLVVAPPGSGKTTLLARFAARAGVPVAWYRAEAWDADEAAVVRHLEAALTSVLPGVTGGWTEIADAARALEAGPGERALLVIDDLHALEGTAAEAALHRFVDYAPPWLAILAGSRVAPRFNLSRRRVSGELLEIAAEDLRFRAWEVERLFRDFYADPVPPSELAVLARRTEGWAAGLQLFHLATRGKSADERRRILAAVGSSSRLVREYLARNVMEELPEDLRDFLVETCVLGRLTGDLCDRLLHRPGSAAILEELVRRQIFTVEVDEADGSYRYHEVLRSHLDRALVERIGEAAARERYARAAALLEAAEAPAEALGAYCRAEDWEAVRRLLGGQGERLAGGAATWLESLPPSIVRHEPWLELAAARRARGAGRWSEALEGYARAETAFGASAIGLVCHRERLTLRSWLEPVAPAPADWTRFLRAGLVREPLGVAREVARDESAPAGLIRGLLSLAAGDVAHARDQLAEAAEDANVGPAILAATELALGVARLLGGDLDGAATIDRAVDAAERADVPWLARLARAASRLAAPVRAVEDAAAAGAVFDPAGDPWGAALVALLEAWDPGLDPRAGADDGPSGIERRLASADRAVAGFRRLGAGVLESWARGLAALAQAEAGAAEARETAIAAESFGRVTGTPGARLLAYRAMALADPARAEEFDDLAATVRQETGLADPPPAEPPIAAVAVGPGRARVGAATERPVRNGHAQGQAISDRNGHVGNGHAGNGHVGPAFEQDTSQMTIRTLGGFALLVGGRPLSLDGVKPRARALLRRLAVNAGAAVHREVLCDALWPEADAQTAGRSLQVAVSALRRAASDALGPAGAGLIARDADAYRLALPAEATDLGRFDALVAAGRLARSRGQAVRPSLSAALAIYAGDLLPEDGPEEWVVEPREQYRTEAVEAARAVAEEALLAGDLQAAVEACRAGLAIDRYADALWRLLIESRDRAGDVGAATRDRRDYEGMLATLGLPERPAVTAS